MKKGYFISFEGGEGAGKSTIASLLKERLEERGFSVVMTREPGGIDISEQIRSVILNPDNSKMDGRTEALLYAASRRQHLIERVSPALEQGKVVLCDRFIDSSLAYQGHARGLGIDEVLGINQFAIGDCMPDLTIYFDLEPEVGLSRIHSDRTREINRLDMEQLHFHHKVREGYHIIMKRFPERIKAVDAAKPISEVYDDVLLLIEKHISNVG